MSREIALIATYSELAEIGRKVADEMNLKLRIEEGLLDNAIPIARTLIEKGVQVIVSRGGTLDKLRKANLGVPLIGIRFTGFDIIRSLQEAMLVGKKVALIVSRDMVYDVENIGSVLNVNVKEYRLHSEKQNRAMVKLAIEEGADVIIAGASVIKEAELMGFPNLLVKSGKEAIWLALHEAKEVAEIRKAEQERSNRLQAILAYANEGIIVTDQFGKINMFNSCAQRMLNIRSEECLEKPWQKAIPQFGLEEQLTQGVSVLGDLVDISHNHFIANKVPIKVNDEITGVVITFQEVQQLQSLEHDIRKKLHLKGHVAKHNFAGIIGESSEIKRCIGVAKRFAKVDSSILLLGETGVGKEVFAQSIHNESPRSKGPFVAINCAVLPSNLLESELFGYAEGAFTGARKKGRTGLFELAHGGTIFLDELGEMLPEIQARLLRVIEEKEVMRLGDEKVIPIDVRVIAATNKDLTKLVKSGNFREDLYYRLNVLKLFLTPLRDRSEDIPMLVNFFCEKFNKKFGKSIKIASNEAMQLLMEYKWPGNVRQLENFIERLFVLNTTNVIFENEVITAFKEINEVPKTNMMSKPVPGQYKVTNTSTLFEVEADTIKKILIETGYNYSKTAHKLGINRTTLWRKLKKLNLNL